MSTTEELIERSIALTEQAIESVYKYFVMGVLITAKTNKDKKAVEKKIKKISPELYENFYLKGVNLIQRDLSETITCEKCKKEIIKEKDLKFCSTCGNTLF